MELSSPFHDDDIKARHRFSLRRVMQIFQPPMLRRGQPQHSLSYTKSSPQNLNSIYINLRKRGQDVGSLVSTEQESSEECCVARAGPLRISVTLTSPLSMQIDGIT